jgi:hypothetical protein
MSNWEILRLFEADYYPVNSYVRVPVVKLGG